MNEDCKKIILHIPSRLAAWWWLIRTWRRRPRWPATVVTPEMIDALRRDLKDNL